MDYKKLGERIREERLKRNLTQAQLAEEVDISDTYMGAIERGGTKPDIGYVSPSCEPIGCYSRLFVS